jgi:transposase-like protein
MTKTFMLNYRYRACQAEIKTPIVEMAINGSGIRDTARVLKINKNTISKILHLQSIPDYALSPAFFSH